MANEYTQYQANGQGYTQQGYVEEPTVQMSTRPAQEPRQGYSAAPEGIPQANQAAAAQAEAVQRDVTPEQLVQSQITSILDGNNPYIQQAERKAMEYANSRGVLNSSIAAGAGRDAAIGAAMPIAQQDAGVFETASRDNQAATNAANLQNAQSETQVNMQNAGDQNRLLGDYMQNLYAKEQLGEEYGLRGILSAQESGQRISELVRDYGLRSGLSAQEAQQELIRQAEAHVQTLEQQAASAEDDQTLARLNNELTMARDAVQQLYGLETLGVEHRYRGELSAQEAEQTAVLSRQEAQQALIRDNQNLLNDLRRQQDQAFHDEDKMRLQAEIDMYQDEINFLQELDIMDKEAGINLDFLAADAEIRRALGGVEQGYAIDLQSLKSRYAILENQLTVSGTMYNDALKSLATMLSEPDLSGQAKAEAANLIIGNLQAGLEWAAGIDGVPTSENFEGTINVPIVDDDDTDPNDPNNNTETDTSSQSSMQVLGLHTGVDDPTGLGSLIGAPGRQGTGTADDPYRGSGYQVSPSEINAIGGVVARTEVITVNRTDRWGSPYQDQVPQTVYRLPDGTYLQIG